jgi:hypothetical protein
MIKVLKQSFDVLDDIWNSCLPLHNVDDIRKAKASLRKAIAELESQEPVAVVDGDAHDIKVRLLIGGINLKPDTKLYTHPPERSESSGKPSAWVGLTDEEFDYLRDNNFGVSPLISAVEAKLREKNSPHKEKNT